MRNAGTHGQTVRSFLTEKEELARLEEYREQLKNELQGIEESLEKLKRK